MTGFPTWALPESSVLRKLYRQWKAHKGVYVAPRPFEQWIPSHVGTAMSAIERRALTRNRETETTKDVAKFIESIQCFWLSHAVVGNDIPPQAIQAHASVLTRLHFEHGLEFAVQYERY